DEDEGLPRSKRAKVDPSGFAWRSRANEFLDSIVLSPEHHNVQEQVELYSRDPKEAVRDLLNVFHTPALPNSQWKPVLLDGFVDFNAILTSSYAIDAEEPQQLVFSDTHLEIKKPKMVTKVSTHGQWINVFRTFEDAVNFAFAGRSRELHTYWNHINDLFSSRHHSQHARIINYNRTARVFIGTRRDVLLNEVHKFRHVQDAHLLDGGVAVTPSGPSNPGGGSKQKPPTKPRKRSQEVCRNFNQGRCRLASECNYRHVCSKCNGGGHPASEC
ncbi:hypothetical protein FB451DRAFT_986916, partial [Mycena latifolia]